MEIIALEPGRLVDNDRKSGRVALGKGVAAKSSQLVKDGLSRFGRYTLRHCPGHKSISKTLNFFGSPLGPQCPAQLLPLPRCKTGQVAGYFQDLFLKENNA